MPSFTFSSRMREGQWRAFRRFMLEERRDAAMRVQAIEAEQDRIGQITIRYAKNADGEVTERRQKLIEEYEDAFNNPYVAAERGLVDEVIEPRETRPRLIRAFEMLRNKRTTPTPKKHGNIPL